MKKSSIQIVIAFSILALIGSVAIQYYWINELYKQNRLLFDSNVNSALKLAVRNIQKEEDIYRINRFHTPYARFADEELNEQSEELNKRRKKSFKTSQNEIILRTETRSTSNGIVIFQNNGKNDIEIFTSLENDSIFLDNNISTGFQIKIETDSILQSFEAKADSLIQVLEFKTIDIKREKEELETTIDQLVWEMDEWVSPFFDSIPSSLIENILYKTLDDYHLPTNFEFAIQENDLQDHYIYQSESFNQLMGAYSYSTNLYPDYLIPKQQKLILQLTSHVLYHKMLLPVLLSFVFTVILAIGLWLIIKNMLHHRNISQVQNDFINNMTHEFKTPIATISLASDSILNPSILHKHDKVSYFTGMIKKENKRMNRLVEKILQMARLENKEFKLEKQKVNVHEIIEMISENTKIKLNGKGDLKIQLNAGNHVVQADQVHLTNVFYNLIDNAIKYSEEPVCIEIHTFNLKNQLFIRIKDSGQGINKKDIQHIFDRFYRVEAGNVHNTKGYGLGLTYVKAVIDKHHGQINVKSELGVGSTFEIRLPI